MTRMSIAKLNAIEPVRPFARGVFASLLVWLPLACEEEGASCPDIDGPWTISQHCEEEYLQDSVTVEQEACSFSTEIEPAELTGTISSSGALEMQGMVGIREMTCDGDARTANISLDCYFEDTLEACEVVLVR